MNERREFAKQVGLGVAWLTPIVQSVVLPVHASTTSTELINLTASLNASNEVPPTNDPGTAEATMTYNSETGDFKISIVTENFSKFTVSHIHSGASGETGGPFVTLEPGDAQGNIDTTGNIPQEHRAALLAGNTYVNLHNEDHPAGAIRGQLTV